MKSEFEVNYDVLENTERSQKQEWLETNGLGAYASSTILDCHTRKYHGYLVSPIEQCPGRFVLLSKIDAVVLAGENEFSLGTNKFPDVFHPTGHRYAEKFEYALHPKTTYNIGDLVIEKSLMMPYGENAVIVKYSLVSGEKNITIQLFPYLAFRNFHHLAHENNHLQVKMFAVKKTWKIEPYMGMPPLFFKEDGKLKFFPGPDWLLRFEYMKEMKRGYDFREDLFCPGMFEAKIKPGQDVYLKVSLSSDSEAPKKSWDDELSRRTKLFSIKEDLDLLKFNSRHFLINNSRKDGAGLIAGFQWFGEWGRDAMISLPGLTLFTKRQKEFLEIMRAFSNEAKDGLIPNERGVDHQGPTYNSVDAGFWYFWALQQYCLNTNDEAKVKKEFGKTMKEILMVYENNKSPYGFVNEDGLLSLGSANTQLTWMDAQVNGVPVTPRNGYAVEINALWFNAIQFYSELCAEDFKKSFPNLKKYLKSIPPAFLKMFWSEELGYLADVVTDGKQDLSVRPNQVIAAAMPNCLVNKTQLTKILQTVDKELFTPYGLRTLSPKNSQYRGFYKGDQKERDASYHQGTVWPWLIGAYTDLFLKVHGSKKKNCKTLLDTIQPLVDSIRENGLGSIGEIREGDAPHHSRGCPMQAWSVAETIRAFEMLRKVK